MALDLALEEVELLLESHVSTWDAMAKRGSPEELLLLDGMNPANEFYDLGFYDGGRVSLGGLRTEIESKRTSLFLGG